MSYTIVDLLDKFIDIEENGYRLFVEMASNPGMYERIRVLARIFAREEEKHIHVYKRLKEEMLDKTNIEVDFSIYDKAVKLVYEFRNSFKNTNLDEPREFLEYCLNFEKENLALVISIQGILVGSQQDSESQNYKILSNIIQEEQKHVQNIENFIK